MSCVPFIMAISLLIFSLVFIPVKTFEVFGKKIVETKDLPRAEENVKRPRRLESLRSSFLEGVEAFHSGKTLIAELFLDGLEKDYPVLGDYILYYRIRAALQSEDTSRVISLADRLLKDYPRSVLTLETEMEKAKALVLNRQFVESKAAVRSLEAKKLESEMRRLLTLLSGEIHEGEGEWKEALSVYQDLAFQEPISPEAREAEQRIDRIRETREMEPEPPAESHFLAKVKGLNRSFQYEDVILTCNAFEEKYPGSKALEEALLLKARALGKRGRVQEGTKLYEKLARSARTGGIRAEAVYRLAAHFWNNQGNARAKREFKKLVKKYPRSHWSAKAYYGLGRIYDGEKNASKAREYFLKIGEVRPGDSLAANGAWRAGWAEYKAGKYKKARGTFDSCVKRYGDSDVFLDALYWKGRCEEKLKNTEKAQKIYRRLADEFSWSFYGVMARRRMELSWNAIPDPLKEMDAPWEPEPLRGEPGSALAFHLDRAEELIQIGLLREATREIDALRHEVPSGPGERCYIGSLYQRSLSYNDSVRWMYRQGLKKACGLERGDKSLPFKRFLYPLAYWETVQKATAKRGLDPFLVLAVMRQESLYQEDVVSWADARGLMQIIPPTGRMIAGKLGVDDFDPGNLFEPETNIAFGVWYLQYLMKRSDGDLVRVLGSYNAGEKRSDRWWDRFKHLEIDERIESITFRETRGYVKKVLRNLENYKRLYGDEKVLSSRE